MGSRGKVLGLLRAGRAARKSDETKDVIMPNPTAAMLVIGDEILSGRTRDANMHYLAGQLTAHGIDLREVRIVSDDAPAIIAAVKALAASHDHVFTSGGIGPTHDDITADCIAAAFDDTIDVRADARALLQAHYDRSGQELNAARLRMARIPSRATLIDNPVSTAPGFTLGNVHVMAGVPSVFQAMVASVLPTLTGGAPLQSRNLSVMRGEGDIAGPLADFAARYPDLSVGSYPFQKDGVYGANLVIRGADAARVDAALAELTQVFAA
jgi:molybdenum cofactor synthesis domain-containing protein